MLYRLIIRLGRRYRFPIVLVLLLLLESFYHVQSNRVSRPSRPLDPPFQRGCKQPPLRYTSHDRANATILMLARNSELEAAVASMKSLERHFNRWFHYPVTFLTGEAKWDKNFVDALTQVVSGSVTFEVIEQPTWASPSWIDKERAASEFQKQEADGVKYGGMADYHNMCRFFSGGFYDHHALRDYKWYWRVEPGVEYTCAVTYDPFLAMQTHNKTYGYNIALWELPETAPSLFQHTSAFKDQQNIPTTALWQSMVTRSWAPFFLRDLIPAKTLRDLHGDSWNLCHFWGNFEIADLDFFRSPGYRKYFETLDRAGGFYYERWGDAPVRSLGASLFLEPEQLHYFRDIGYGHPPFQNCPKNAAGLQLPSDALLGQGGWSQEFEEGEGCRCECDTFGFTNRPICLRTLRRGVE